jgi:POT family proton-dependent oligopeptide transporter
MSGLNIDDDVVGYKHDPTLAESRNEKHDANVSPPGYAASASTDDDFPTDEELTTLPRIPDKVPWKAFPIAFVELCERFSYYGTTVVFVNFLQQPLPPGSTTGAGGTFGQAGALGQKQRVSTGLVTFNSFWVYVLPLFGAYVADTYWGRYKTIAIALAIAIFGHILLIMAALPSVIANPSGSIGCFAVAIIIMGIGTGAFKANISPLVAEQYRQFKMRVVTEKSGRRVIIDPALTISRIYQYFYLMINIGALVGQISMVYAEKYVGFWLSFTLPTLCLCVCPLVMWWGRKRYVRMPPQGSVLSKALHIWVYAMKGRWSINPVTTFKNMNDGTMWDKVKPSTIAPADRPSWMTFDDVWVDEVRRGFKACSVFLWYPLYWLTYNQMTANMTSQAADMALHGVPNDIVNNLDPFALIILIPICDLFIYPAIRRAGFDFSPIKKITGGFFTGSLAMIWACVIQVYIYRQSPCGNQASTCADDDGNPITVGINVWAQTGAYILIAISEILASITGLEYAFTKAPKNMRSLVMSAFLFMSAISSAVGEAFVSLSADPLLVWNYGTMAVISFLAGIGFWMQYRHLDRREDVLNAIGEGNLNVGAKDEEHLSTVPDPSKAGEHPARQTVDDVKS